MLRRWLRRHFFSPPACRRWGGALLRVFGPAAASADANRILVVRLDEIGDVVMTFPLLRELRRARPRAWITFVVKPGVLNLAQACPYVDEALAFDGGRGGRLGEGRRYLRAFLFARRHLWRRRFGLALSPRWDVDGYGNALLCFASAAPRRVGYGEAVAEWKRQASEQTDEFLTQRLVDDTWVHEVEHNLHVLQALEMPVAEKALELWAKPEDERRASRFLEQSDGPHRPLVALGVGARFDAKRWPFENYRTLAASLREAGYSPVLIGDGGDLSLGPAANGVLDARGALTLRETFALLKRCALFVGNDSGPKHMAAAAGIPIIEISCHPRSASARLWPWPSRFSAWAPSQQTLRPARPVPPCVEGCTSREPHCVASIPPKEVLLAIESLKFAA